MENSTRLLMKGIKKSFSGVQVLKNVDLQLKPGRVLGLLGENGAGKSTLIKILNGDYTKDDGDILINERAVNIQSPRDAANQGVQVIYQELNYLSDVSVMENILLGNLPRKNRCFVNWKEAYLQASSILKKLGTNIQPDENLGRLSIADKQLVEISKALSKDAEILIMDEPTAALTSKEVQDLFKVIKDLKKNNVSIIYITHHLDEVMEICDDVMIMRDGRKVGAGPINTFTKEQIIELMVGRRIVHSVRTDYGKSTGDVTLEVKDLEKEKKFKNISFEAKKGEILGIFGLLGSGKESLSKALFGEEIVNEGDIIVNGKKVELKSPVDAKEAGIAYVPSDRKISGLVLGMSVKDNLTLASMHRVSKAGFFNKKAETSITDYWVERLKIKLSGDIGQPIQFLSGGNQQKVILSRWLVDQCKLLVLCEPTMGVDVGAREDIYSMLKELRREGITIIVVSSDMTELESLADRVIVLKEGQLVKELIRNEITGESMLAAAMGG